MSLKNETSTVVKAPNIKIKSFKTSYPEFKNKFSIPPTIIQRECDDERLLEMGEMS
jgi:hypothetical protein